MPSHVPTFSAALFSSHTAADGQKKPIRNGMTESSTSQRNGVTSNRQYTAERISPRETSRIARGKPIIIGSVICAATHTPMANPSGNHRRTEMPYAFTMTPSSTQKRRPIIVHTGILVLQDCIKVWAKLLAELHEVFILSRLGFRVAGLGLFRSNVQPSNIRRSPLFSGTLLCVLSNIPRSPKKTC